MTCISLIKAAPPAARKEPEMIDGLVDTDLRHTLEVPPIALLTKDRIVRHPEDGSKVSWRVTDLSRNEDGHMVAAYVDGEAASEFTFEDPKQWVMVDAGQVSR